MEWDPFPVNYKENLLLQKTARAIFPKVKCKKCKERVPKRFARKRKWDYYCEDCLLTFQEKC